MTGKKRCVGCGKLKARSEYQTEVKRRGFEAETKNCQSCRVKRNAQRQVDRRREKAAAEKQLNEILSRW